MNNINKLKSLVSITLSIIIMFSSITLNAASPMVLLPSPTQHKETINAFIREIKDAQTQSAYIAQSAFKNSITNISQLQLQIDTISNNLNILTEIIEDYADIVQGLNEQDRQVRLTFNYLNLVRSNLYTLTLLIRATTDIERLQLLDEYFRTRINASNTLAILETLLENYNT